jgi:hypothetical protein
MVQPSSPHTVSPHIHLVYALQATIGDIFLRISFMRQLVAQRSCNLVGFRLEHLLT